MFQRSETLLETPELNGRMETTATILHADLDAFYASVEQLLETLLHGSAAWAQ